MRLVEAFRAFGPELAEPEAGAGVVRNGNESPTPAHEDVQVGQVAGLVEDTASEQVAVMERQRLELKLVQEAAELINEKLAAAERRLRGRFKPELLEEARGDLALKLLLDGPRGIRNGEPDTDEGVERWLTTSMVNQVLDILKRKFKREITGQDLLDLMRADGGPNDLVNALITSERLAQVGELLPLAKQALLEDASELGKGSLEELFELFQEAVTFEQVVARHGDDTRTMRNRIYKRHERALDRAFLHVVVLLVAGQIDNGLYDVCGALLREMVRRSTGAAEEESHHDDR